ncbi:MAG: hypothetical protein ACOZQL_41310, partial [Myxococcota bacterium]
MTSRAELQTEFVMSPQHVEGPETLGPTELLERAKLLDAFGRRLVLFGTQRIRPTEELAWRVRDLLRRYADVRAGTTIRPNSPLAVYFRARLTLVLT